MAEFDALERAVDSFGRSIANFPVGAISINDLKPTTEKIQDLRYSLRGLDSRILMLKAKVDSREVVGVAETSEEEDYVELLNGISNLEIQKKAALLGLQNDGTSRTFQSLVVTEETLAIEEMMPPLYSLSDKIMFLHNERVIAMAKESELKLQLEESLFEFKNFLKELEGIRKKKLEKLDPVMARQKESMEVKLRKVNVMKGLIQNFIATSSSMAKVNPLLDQMLEDHRELVDLETVMKPAQE